jgi:AraC family transcriptional regulator
MITSRHAPGEKLPPHVHLSSYLSFVLRGAYAEHAWGTVIERETFTLRFHPAGEEHEDRFGPAGALCLNIQLLDGWEETLDRVGIRRGIRTCDEAAPRVLSLCRRRQAGDVDRELALEEAVLELLGWCAVSERRDDVIAGSAALRRALTCVNDTLPGRISLTMVAAVAGVHPTHLARLFQSRLGCTLSGYVRARRLSLAQRALAAHPDRHFSRVALECGFADQAHFSRSFRRECDMSPSNFRELLQATCLRQHQQ